MKRKARCTYFGATTYKVKRYSSCECSTCIKSMGDSDTGKCSCEREVDSNSAKDLAFFKQKPEKPFDEFYCGCLSWN